MVSFLQAITLWLLAELILGSTNLDTIADYAEFIEHRRTNIVTFITCQSRWSNKYHFNVSFTHNLTEKEIRFISCPSPRYTLQMWLTPNKTKHGG